MDKVDAIVVGARCAGSATARLLALAGKQVVVMDRASFPSDTVSTHAIAGHGVSLLQRWGLFDRIAATGVPNPKVLSVRVGALQIDRMPLGDDHPGTFGPRRTVLDAILVDAAEAAGAQVWTNTTVDDLVFAGERVVGVRGRRGTQPFELHADLVIGADGVRSRVADLVGAAHYDVLPSNSGGVYAYFAETGIDHSGLGFNDHRGVVSIRTNDDLVCVGVLVPDQRTRALIRGGDAAFLTELGAAWPELGEVIRGAKRATRFVTFRPHPSSFRTAHGPGWALVGDAGHYKDPVTGQGIADAFLDAQLLTDALAGGDDLSIYQAQRDAIGREMHAVSGAMSMLACDDEEAVALFLRFRAAAEATMQTVAALPDQLVAP
jgi:2-polyprenyl-6-methoxyphenol hydroxylase-like FAD-dependent oxidoreductase